MCLSSENCGNYYANRAPSVSVICRLSTPGILSDAICVINQYRYIPFHVFPMRHIPMEPISNRGELSSKAVHRNRLFHYVFRVVFFLLPGHVRELFGYREFLFTDHFSFGLHVSQADFDHDVMISDPQRELRDVIEENMWANDPPESWWSLPPMDPSKNLKETSVTSSHQCVSGLSSRNKTTDRRGIEEGRVGSGCSSVAIGRLRFSPLDHPLSLVCYCVAVFLRAAFRSVGLRACTSVWGAARRQLNRGRPSRRQAPATLPSARRARTRFLRLGSALVVFTLRYRSQF
ncbi:hypothetical protein EVAR_59213_1 [Eumeta japonica]|uniref:Uncharacterized protein n=1 Tax=Eumeta variegata TaxID=151549 RepID=A0A4C1YXI8_EUMVA|nr:hypothetical protein EVAR_59213_1 [Eumeta japonica]